MRCKCRVLSVNGVPASDGSIIPVEIMNSYINSKECQEALKNHKMLGTLTHRSRSIQSVFPDTGAALSKVVGKDDSLYIVDPKAPSPTHYIENLYIEEGWLWANIKILEEDGMDDVAIQNIRRLRGLLSQGVHPGVSAVIVGYWDSTKGQGDVLRLCKTIKGIDITANASWGDAKIEEIYDDDKKEETKEFSEKEEINASDYEFKGLKVKTFSNLNELGISGPKSSKIDGTFTKLKAKEFSCMGVVEELSDVAIIEEEKEFSMPAIKERLREKKMGPRMELRRVYLGYKQMVKSMGGVENIKPEELKMLKSMFSSDVLNIMSSVSGEIMQGKQINTLLGLSSLSKTARLYGQKLQQPLRMSYIRFQKQGYLTKDLMSKLQTAYTEFIDGLMTDVFGTNPEPIPAEEEEVMNEENK